jgi:ABC-type thiamin/hydroxymethylpyrimidine transport system permease subunit
MNKAYSILAKINEIIINPLILLLFGVALLFFVYGVFEYILKARANPAKMKEGRSHMLWGLVGMFVMISVFGFFKILLNTLPVGERSRDNVNRVLDIK